MKPRHYSSKSMMALQQLFSDVVKTDDMPDNSTTSRTRDSSYITNFGSAGRGNEMASVREFTFLISFTLFPFFSFHKIKSIANLMFEISFIPESYLLP